MTEDTKDNDTIENPVPNKKFLTLAVGIVFGLWLLNLSYGWFLLWQNTEVGEHVNAGIFGDMFGASNALFSGLSIIGIVYAIHQQDQQLKIARDEVKTAHKTLAVALEDADKTKRILDEQQAHLREQNEATKVQMLESTLFKLLDNLNLTIESIRIRDKTGKVALQNARFLMFRDIKISQPEEEILEHINKFLLLNKDIRDHILSYTRQYTNIVSYINLHFKQDLANIYYSLLSSSMTNSEIIIIYYLSIYDKSKGINVLYSFSQNQNLTNIVKFEEDH